MARTKPQQPFLYHGHPSSRGLVGVWPLGEAAGTITRDFSGYRNHGTIIDADWVASGRGPVVDFDGISSCVQMGNPAELQIAGSLTLAALFRHDVAVSAKRLVSKYGYSMTAHNDKPYFYTRKADDSGWDPTASGPTYTRGGWVLAVSVFDAKHQKKRVWTNGAPGAVISKTDGTCGAVSTYDFRVGSQSWAANFFPGQISLAAIWDRALGAAEIAALHVDPFAMFRPPRRPARRFPTVGGPYFADSGGLWHTGAAAAQTFNTGPTAGQIHGRCG